MTVTNSDYRAAIKYAEGLEKHILSEGQPPSVLILALIIILCSIITQLGLDIESATRFLHDIYTKIYPRLKAATATPNPHGAM